MRRLPLIALALVPLTPVVAQQTQPVMPKVQETPLPAPVTLPPPPHPAPADVPNRPLTADEAAAIALNHQPGITVARAAIASAAGRTRQVRSNEMPGTSATTSYSRIINNVLTSGGEDRLLANRTTGSAFLISTTTTQLIYDFNHTRDLVRQARAQQASACAGLTVTQSDLVLQVKQSYYTYAQDLRLITVQEDALRNQRVHLDLAKARVNAGLGLPSDVVRAETAVADAVLNLSLAQNAAAVARVSLAEFMGIDPRTPVQVSDAGEADIASNDVNALVDQGLRLRPEICQAQANIAAAQSGLGAARTNNAPAVTAGANYANRGASFPPNSDSLTLILAIQFDVFDGGFTAGGVEIARANLTSAQAQLTSTQLTVVSDVSQAYLNLRTAENRIPTADSEVANAQESLRLARGRYEAGIGTFIDVLDSENALSTAQTNRVNAQTTINQAKASLAHAIGLSLKCAP